MCTPALGVLPLDIFLCMLYNKDDRAIRKTIRPFLVELGKDFDCSDLLKLVDCLPLVGLRCVCLLLSRSLIPLDAPAHANDFDTGPCFSCSSSSTTKSGTGQ
jgi:hypothetical protein